MKAISCVLLFLFPTFAGAEWITHKDGIKDLNVWPNGSDEWGFGFLP